VGVEVRVEGLTKSFGRQRIWGDVTLTLPAGEISVLLGPSGTGRSVFLKTVVGLLKPDRGDIWIEGKNLPRLRERELYAVRRLFGVLFQDGALFGSMNLYDNIAFPLREHTKKSETEIRRIVGEKMELVGLLGDEKKLPGEISGGMRKRAGLARALVLDPEIMLFDEPDSGLDPVRTAYLNQLIVDLNAQIGATFLIVTHDINTARTVPDNIGLLYRRHLAMFGPREMLLSSNEPVVRQFLNARRQGPIGIAPAVERCLTHRLDVARSYARKRNDVGAIHMIQHIHRESPEELTHSVIVREVLRELMGRARPAVMSDRSPCCKRLACQIRTSAARPGTRRCLTRNSIDVYGPSRPCRPAGNMSRSSWSPHAAVPSWLPSSGSTGKRTPRRQARYTRISQ